MGQRGTAETNPGSHPWGTVPAEAHFLFGSSRRPSPHDHRRGGILVRLAGDLPEKPGNDRGTGAGEADILVSVLHGDEGRVMVDAGDFLPNKISDITMSKKYSVFRLGAGSCPLQVIRLVCTSAAILPFPQ